MARGKKDWVVGPWTSDRDQPSGVAGTQFYTLIDGAELEEKDDRLTVLRIVGDLWTIPTDATNMANGGILYWHGIKVFETDNAGALLPLVPFNFADADASWMYIRMGYFVCHDRDTGGGRLMMETLSKSDHLYSNSGWGGDHIDIQVKRKLQANEVLICAMGAQQDLPYDNGGLGVSLTHNIWLRTLVGNL